MITKKILVLILFLSLVLTACEQVILLQPDRYCTLGYDGADYVIETLRIDATADGRPVKITFDVAYSGRIINVKWSDLEAGQSKISNMSQFKDCVLGSQDTWNVSGNKEQILSWFEGYFNLLPVQDSTTAFQVSQPTTVPQILTQEYVFRRLDGSEIKVSNPEQARQGFEGGELFMAEFMNGIEVGRTKLEDIVGFERPKGSDGTPINLPSAQSEYFVNEKTGVAFLTKEEAVSEAKTRGEAVNIHVYVKGVDNGIVENIPEFNIIAIGNDGKPVSVGPNEEYLQTSLTSGGTIQTFDYTLDQTDKARQLVCSNETGGSIYVMKLGQVQSVLEVFSEWRPDEQVASILGEDICKRYYLYQDKPYPSLSAAQSAAGIEWWFKKGGTIIEMQRGTILTTIGSMYPLGYVLLAVAALLLLFLMTLIFALVEKKTAVNAGSGQRLRQLEKEAMNDVLVRLRSARKKVLKGLLELTIHSILGYFVVTNLIQGNLIPLVLYLTVGLILLIFGWLWQNEVKSKIKKNTKKE